MGKRTKDAGVSCPYYHSEDAQKIYCDGVQEGSWVHLAFGSKADKKAYKRDYCRGCFGRCWLAKMQMSMQRL